jgi:hypothetical protein
MTTMSAAAQCLALFRKTAGREVSDEEIDDFLTAFEAHKRYLKSKDSGLNDTDAALRAADEVANRLELAAIIEKRNAALNYTRRLERVGWIGNTFPNDIAKGIEAMLVGIQSAKQGARLSVAAQQSALRKAYLGGFVSDLERSGNMALFASGSMDRDVARALWMLDQPDMAPMLARLPREAADIARTVRKWQETARIDANTAGAWVGKRVDYITRQSHDSVKIKRAGYEEWRRAALQTFDIPQMLVEHGAVDVDAMLRATWANLASGNHLKEAPEDVTGFKGPGNLAKKLSQSRSILFKDADSWVDYNAAFGTGNLRETVLAGLGRSAESTALMQMLGTNPAAMLDAIKGDLTVQAKAAGKVDSVAKLGEKAGELDRYMAAVDGSMNIPGNALWARRAANVRAWETLAKLGGMLLSQVADLGVYASGASYQGRGFFSGMGEAVAGLGRSLKPQERRDLAASLGVMLDNMAGELGRVGSLSEGSATNAASRAILGVTNTALPFLGHNTTLTQLFMKMNGAQWWTSRMRTSAAFGMSHHMALQAGKGWADLGVEYQRVLGLYGLGEAEWKVISQTAAKNVDGKAYIVPEGLREVSDDAMRGYIGQAAGAREMNAARRDLEDKLRTYFTDQTETLALEPDVKTRAIILQGSRPGTWTGEFFRFAMQFKSFAAAFTQRILGRELYGRGYEGDSLWGALRNGNGEVQGLAKLIVTTTLMGYASMALKDVAKGRTPRDPTEDPVKTFTAAMLQGGGLGIYGDFLFGQASRMGSGTIESLAGPTISAGARFIDLYHKALAGDDVAARTLNEALNNTPFANLFYTRAALNYFLLYEVQEAMNPGYLRRMERQVEKEQGQGFLLRPSEVVR